MSHTNLQLVCICAAQDVVANIFLAISLFCGAVPMGFYRDQWIGYINQGTAEEIRRYNLNGIATTMGASAVSFALLIIQL